MQGRISIAVLFGLVLVLAIAMVGIYFVAERANAQISSTPRRAGELVPVSSGGASAGIAASDGFVYVVDSGTIYKLNAITLEVVKTSAYKNPASTDATPARRITTPQGG